MQIITPQDILIDLNGPVLLAASLVGTALAARNIRNLSYTNKQIILLLIPAWLFGLPFAKVGHLANLMLAAVNPFQAVSAELPGPDKPLSVFLLYGYSSIGGLIGAGLYGWLYCVIQKRSALKLADACIVPALLMYAIARTGCAIHGCCYGIEVHPAAESALSMLLDNRDGVSRLPLQCIDSLLSFSMCAILCVAGKNRPRAGRLLSMFLLLYPTQRFLLDFLRGDRLPISGSILSATQWACLFAFTGGILLLFHPVRPASRQLSKP